MSIRRGAALKRGKKNQNMKSKSFKTPGAWNTSACAFIWLFRDRKDNSVWLLNTHTHTHTHTHMNTWYFSNAQVYINIKVYFFICPSTNLPLLRNIDMYHGGTLADFKFIKMVFKASLFHSVKYCKVPPSSFYFPGWKTWILHTRWFLN